MNLCVVKAFLLLAACFQFESSHILIGSFLQLAGRVLCYMNNSVFHYNK